MTELTYRLYSRDRTGRRQPPEDFLAANDEAAVAEVTQRHPSSQGELWQADRLVLEIPLAHCPELSA
jgi:hypothetical protein